MAIPASELILNADGSIYHLALVPEQLAEKVILVGNPDRVATVSKYFDDIECQVQNREIVTHTGSFQGQRISVISTGMGVGCVDIVVNELDALVNIDLEKRQVKDKLSSLELVRLGTAGGLQTSAPVDTFVVATHAIGLDGLMNFYCLDNNDEERDILAAFNQHVGEDIAINPPYITAADGDLLSRFKPHCEAGINVTAGGFYAPQGRQLRAKSATPDILDVMQQFKHKEHQVLFFEMESSTLFALGRLLNHKACTVCAIVANRATKQFASNAQDSIEKLIQLTLETLS